MTKADAWMPFYIADYLRKTMHLTRDQHGGYFLLIMACWDNGGKLPKDEAFLAATVKASPAEWRKLAPTLLKFFEDDGEQYIQRRVLREHEKAARLSEIRRETGGRGGRPKKQPDSKQKPIGYDERNQNGLQTETPASVARPSPAELAGPSEPANISTRERSEARLDGASGFRVIEGGEAEAWRQAWSEAKHDLPHFNRTDPDYASEIAEFIEVAVAKLESMVVAA